MASREAHPYSLTAKAALEALLEATQWGQLTT